MTDKEKIKAEVERLRKLHQLKYQQLDAEDKMCLVECGKRNLCNELLDFIDSLPEETSEDLEEEAKGYAWARSHIAIDKKTYKREVIPSIENTMMIPIGDELKQAVIFGGQWQKKQIKKLLDLGEPPYLISVEQAYYRIEKYLEESK